VAGEEARRNLLFQLGGPDSLEAVEPFLLNLFSIRTSFLLSAGNSAAADCQTDFLAALDSGCRQVRRDRQTLADSFADRTQRVRLVAALSPISRRLL